MSLSRRDHIGHTSPNGRPPVLSRKGLLRRITRVFLLFILFVMALLVAGFLWFADSVTSMRSPDKPKADAIIVLTGGHSRIDQALTLLKQDVGQRLLISGANPNTSAGQIRRITQSSAALFNCCVDIGYDALDTIGNANEAARWISDHNYKTILVVTNNYHIHRSLLELRRASPNTSFQPYPVVNANLATTNWLAKPDAFRTLLSEYIKLLGAASRIMLGYGNLNGLRSSDIN